MHLAIAAGIGALVLLQVGVFIGYEYEAEQVRQCLQTLTG